MVRDDGRPTYLLADIAYHRDKIERGYDRIYDIWGPDHHGYISRLSGAVQTLGYKKENFKVIISQQVNLLESGQKVKMSKRAGSFQTMSDLIGFLGKHGKDVGRYFFVMRSLDAPLDFDLDLAQDQSDKNPVFICSMRMQESVPSFERWERKVPPQRPNLWRCPKSEKDFYFGSQGFLRKYSTLQIRWNRIGSPIIYKVLRRPLRVFI